LTWAGHVEELRIACIFVEKPEGILKDLRADGMIILKCILN
jgi:hypothetical protein